MMERTTAQGAALAAELRNLMRQAEALMDALSQDRKEALAVIRDRIATAVVGARARLGDLEQSAHRLRQRAQVAATEFGQENPWTVVAFAAALGLLVGAALAQRRRL